MDQWNVTVAEAIGLAHAALLEDLCKTEAACHASSRVTAAEVRARLSAVRAHLADHFRYEEQGGYMEAVRLREPQLERTIQQLGDEHPRLLRLLDALLAESTGATRLDDRFREEVRAWIEGVRQHEARETRLVQDVFNSDFDAED
jgi:hemerythrin